jgi:6-phosphogluconolactonase
VHTGEISGSVALLSVDERSGDLLALVDFIPHLDETDPAVLADPRRTQENENSHCHGVHWDATGRWLFACEKGLDKVIVYSFDIAAAVRTTKSHRSGALLRWHSEVRCTPGGGARHLVQHPGGHTVYCNEESGGLVQVYAWDAETGVLTPRQTIACAEDLSGIGTSEISLGGPGGRYLYVSSRGPRTIATFYVEEDGLLTAVGETPTGPGNRHFTLDPSGRWMLVGAMGSHEIEVHEIGEEDGLPRATGHTLTTPTPACVVFACL